MRFGFAFGENPSPWERWMEEGLTRVLTAHDHRISDSLAAADVVFHRVDPMRPRAYRRQYQATFVVGLVEGDESMPPLKTLYPMLIRSISNLLMYGGFTSENRAQVTMATPELGHYAVEPSADVRAWFGEIYERIAPLAESHLVIDNVFDEDLPEELWNGTPVTDAMREASRTLDRWELFPTPFPVSEVLPPDDMRHLRHLFGIGGLSYGNLSARHDEERFWMSASGVDKGKIGTVSRDILLVKTYDPTIRAMRLSVKPGADPLRVSVDAVEHWGVYRRHPEIGAIIHIHAWVDDVATTTVNYPCGTVEMGDAMSDLLDRDLHPERTIIGLKNHGITATGPTFQDILERLEGRVRTTVPMQ
ncbi:MAG: class II aldolase/adducin family protein [Clostridia bacterium]